MNEMIRKILIILTFSGVAQAQSVPNLYINEIMSANVTTISDADGDFPDWIELYNGSSTPIRLRRMGLSDQPTVPLKWQFPDLILGPGQVLLIFASDKDIRLLPGHWETVIDWGDAWSYWLPAANLPSEWTLASFDDSAWATGASGFGYGDADDATDLAGSDPFQPSPVSIYIRKKFNLENPVRVVAAYLHVDYDDGFVAYLNGSEIARANLGVPGIAPEFDRLADQPHEAAMYRGGAPEKFVISDLSRFCAGENILALQVHNADLYSSDLSLIPFLTLEMTAVPANARGSSPHLEFPRTRHLHTNFKIKAAGETLVLADSNGQIIDQVRTPGIPADVSLGRQPDGGSDWLFFAQPTPGSLNTTPGFRSIAPAPQFSRVGGIYSAPFRLELANPGAPGAVIHYTLDGSTPTEMALLYSNPISIDSTRVVRARGFDPGVLPGPVVTHSYFLHLQPTLPVISLATDPANFWDHEIGIYVFGANADTVNYPYWGANFWQDWERPVHVEFFEPDGRPGFAIDAGVQIFGSWSRLYPQKALALFARNRYGSEAINYAIFPDKNINSFQALILRNSGQDWGRTFFRDAMMHYLVKDLDLETQAYRPALVYLNGAFLGLHNIREKMNEHFLASNCGVDADALDFLERDSMIIQGDDHHYQRLLSYIGSHDLNQAENYQYVQTQMDVENFMVYILTVMYYANSDWPWNNVKCWRPRTDTGRWRWLLYDLDYGFHGGHLGPESNLFAEMHAQDNGTTFLFFKLLENPTFRNQFINYFADHLNITFKPERVIKIIQLFQAGIEAEMPRQIQRWQHSFEGPWWLGKSIDSMAEWHQHIQVLIDYANQRPDHVRQHIIDEFRLMDGGVGTLQLDVRPPQSGKIKINSLVLTDFPWQGQYFIEVPIQLGALANPGYRFSGWQGAQPSESQIISVKFTAGQTIVAQFSPDSSGTGNVVINEINYRSASHFNTDDWVEFYNHSEQAVDLSGWYFSDAEDEHRFQFPPGTLLTAHAYLILCRDRAAFRQFFSNPAFIFGDFDFGLSSDGERIRLYDSQGQIMDEVIYGSLAPWPTAANGGGPTLELIQPDLDNALPKSWQASIRTGGTPGAPNSVLTGLDEMLAVTGNRFALEQNYPNPFNAYTRIRFTLPAPERVQLRLFNSLGKQVKVLLDQQLSAGTFAVMWDGTDEGQRTVSSGIYFYELTTPTQKLLRKSVFIR